MGFSRQGYWSGLPFPPPGGLPDPGTEPKSPALQADSLLTELRGKLHYLIGCKEMTHWKRPWCWERLKAEKKKVKNKKVAEDEMVR